MEKALVHRGYAGSIEVSLEDGCLHGRLLYVDDLITYEAESVPELETAFREAVDRYLTHCKAIGKRPDKPCSGSFNVRLGAVLHRQAAIAAAQSASTLNDFVVKAVQAAVEPAQAKTVVHEHHVVIEDLMDLGQRVASSSSAVEWESHGPLRH